VIGASPNTTRTVTLYGLSKRAYNGTLYYEDKKFSARGSVGYRSPLHRRQLGDGQPVRRV
jgi:iron complex outermembrane receptor protein